MTQNNTDEIDLGVVFQKISESFNRFLISLYKGFQFILKYWWLILLLAIIGGAIGYYVEENRKGPKTTTLIVQNNFQSSNYVYSAIEQLNNKITDGDKEFLQKAGFRTDTVVLGIIRIEPVVNIIELMDKTMYSYRTLEPLLDKADFQEELLTSEVFIPDYKYHKIHLNTSYYGDESTIDNLINYLNNNDQLNEIKSVVVEDTKAHIKGFDETIASIDGILKAYGQDGAGSGGSQLMASGQPVDLGELVNSKLNILNQRERYKTELSKYDNIVTVMNKPELHQIVRTFSVNMKSMAFLFVFGFLLLAYLNYRYKKVKQLAENQK